MQNISQPSEPFARKKRWMPTAQQKNTMTEEYIKRQGNITTFDIHAIALKVVTTEERVKNWFSNHRTKLQARLRDAQTSQNFNSTPDSVQVFAIPISQNPKHPIQHFVEIDRHSPPLRLYQQTNPWKEDLQLLFTPKQQQFDTPDLLEMFHSETPSVFEPLPQPTWSPFTQPMWSPSTSLLY
ncbi:hypothetical protein BLNAU_17342 [Blattamonas nauphoetae]|uniref:Homeobox domain-containing protein n=1 Tax=Blattamonas nauphoetae TaxID=2049346 RepID=A0ABQ9XAS0_9EUKA|nr:hypothetical protein BLNAU_17342 [Blattamonas nauphoetae]